MLDVIKSLVRKHFSIFINEHGFSIENEISDESSYLIKFRSDLFCIKIEKYFREFYIQLYKDEVEESEINLFNLLEFVNKDTNNLYESNYFSDEKDITTCYEKQLEYNSKAILDNFMLIKDFFKSKDLKKKLEEITQYLIEENPDLY